MNESPRNRGGAPKGNKNALKHGFYSQLNRQEKRPSPPTNTGQLQPDIVLYRALIARLIASLASGQLPPPTFDENLAILQLVCIAVARVNSLWHTNARLFSGDNQSLLSTFGSFGFTEEQLQSVTFVSPKAHTGGQVGNGNALKHGLYASALSPAETSRLDPDEPPSVLSEVNLVRVFLGRASFSMRSAVGLDLAAHLKALRVFTLATTVIERLERRKLPAFSGPNRLEDLVDRLIKEGEKEGESHPPEE